jgi:hypothetical protein
MVRMSQTVIVSTFDNFTSLLEPAAVKQNIPIVTQEIADTWIYVRASIGAVRVCTPATVICLCDCN